MNQSLKKYISTLPKSPGVYKFYDTKNKLIYIGKATSLRDRVRSYFSGAHDRKTEILVSQIEKIKFEQTENVLEALILESNLIKKNQPKYNIDAKDDKSFSYFLITKNEDFSRVLIVRKTDLGKYSSKKIFGPYTSKSQMETALKIIRKIFPFHSRKEKTEKSCLDYQLGQCPGPYAKAITKKDYQKNIRGIELILSGKKKFLIKRLEKEMNAFSKKHEYEKAAEARNKIFALQHIQDVALISEEKFQVSSFKFQKNIRIEGYDISNIGGDYAVGSMVVFINGKPDKSQYRRFKIKTVAGINDIKMMQEVLGRRSKRSDKKLGTGYWALPNLILIDGGKTHLNMAEKLLNDADWNIPIVAIAKGPTRKKLDLYYTKNAHGHFEIISDLTLLEKIRDEAHRFAIAYHRQLRRTKWMKQ
jgi:excinuclease ABC subunit C